MADPIEIIHPFEPELGLHLARRAIATPVGDGYTIQFWELYPASEASLPYYPGLDWQPAGINVSFPVDNPAAYAKIIRDLMAFNLHVIAVEVIDKMADQGMIAIRRS